MSSLIGDKATRVSSSSKVLNEARAFWSSGNDTVSANGRILSENCGINHSMQTSLKLYVEMRHLKEVDIPAGAVIVQDLV